MTGRLLALALLILGSNLFGLGYISSNRSSFDTYLLIVLGISVLLSTALVGSVTTSLRSKKKEKKKQKKETKESNVRYSAVIPVRLGKVCMVSSSDGKRWVFPKGRVEQGENAGETALREVWEEAGLLGSLEDTLGSYLYEKDDKKHFAVVFRMSILEEVKCWPESVKRERCWLNPSEAAERLSRGDTYLRTVLLSLECDELTPSSQQE